MMKKTTLLLWGILVLFSAPVLAEDAIEHVLEALPSTERPVDEPQGVVPETAPEHEAPLIEEGLSDDGAEHADTSHSSTTDEHHGDSAEDGLPQFNPASFPSQIFWFCIVFVILYIVFSRRVLPQISKVIEIRTEHIQTDLDAAEDLKKEAESIQQAYEDILDAARHKSEGSFSDVEETIRDRSEIANQDFRKHSIKAIEKAEKAVTLSKSKILAEIDSIAVKIAQDASEKITGIPTKPDHALRVVEMLQGKKKAA